MQVSDIARALGVGEATVRNYIHSEPAREVQEMMDHVEAQVRVAAVQELKRQLREAGERSRSAMKPVKVWQGPDGSLNVRDVIENGEVVDRHAVPTDVELMPDEEARYMSRREAREIVDQLVKLTGAGETTQLGVTIEFSEETIETDWEQ